MEPAIERLKNQLLVKRVSPRLVAAKAILASILWGFKRDRRYKSLTLNLAKRAAIVLDQISRIIESTEESPDLIQNIQQLEQTLQNIELFVHSKTQCNRLYQRLFAEDISDRYFALDHELTSLLNTFEGDLELSPANPEDSGTLSKYQTPLPCFNGFPNPRSGMFSQTRNMTVKGGQFYNIQGNFSSNQPGMQSQTTETIIQTLRVVPTEDISMAQEIMSCQEYRLYSGHISGRAIAIKLYKGPRAKQICLASAELNCQMMHPSILHMIGSSSADSNLSFLVFDGDYEGVAESRITVALEKDLKQSLILGIETVIGLSSGLDHLRDLESCFEDARLEDFIVLLNREGKVKLSFDPKVKAKHGERTHIHDEHISNKNMLDTFHGLCQRTFDAACQAHYKGQKFQLEYPDLLADDQSGIPKDRSEDLDGDAESNPSARIPSTTEPQRPPIQGSRRELVWKSQYMQNIPPHDSLCTISRQFQAFLMNLNTSSEPTLHRYRGRYATKRTAHRCPGYSRIEITLTMDITQSAIVSHSTPTVQEICPVCKEVVADQEIFNCTCGREDDESMPTIRCPGCCEWHHRSCLATSKLHKVACGRCLSNYSITATFNPGGDADFERDHEQNRKPPVEPPPSVDDALPNMMNPFNTPQVLILDGALGCRLQRTCNIYIQCGHRIQLPDEEILCYNPRCKFSPSHPSSCRPPSCIQTCIQQREYPEQITRHINAMCPYC